MLKTCITLFAIFWNNDWNIFQQHFAGDYNYANVIKMSIDISLFIIMFLGSIAIN